jgi:S1-C subfamily serine protease
MEGGPVFKENGEVVGILTYKYAASQEYESLSRFIPINNVKNCLESLINNEEYNIPAVGIQVMDLYVAASLGNVTWADSLGVYEGCYVDSVIAGGAATSAGMIGDCVIVGAYLNDEYYTVKNSNYISIILARYKKGDTLKLVVHEKQEKKEYIVFNG